MSEFVGQQWVLANAVANGELVVVSYDNAVATDRDVLPTMLRAIGIGDELLGRLCSAVLSKRNARGAWRRVEISRVLNGVLAERLGLPQDDLFQAHSEFRTCSVMFDLADRVPSLGADTLASLETVIESRATAKVLRAFDGATELEGALSDQFGSFFVNSQAGRIFPRAPYSKVTFSDWSWKEFMSSRFTLMERAMADLGLA